MVSSKAQIYKIEFFLLRIRFFNSSVFTNKGCKILNLLDPRSSDIRLTVQKALHNNSIPDTHLPVPNYHQYTTLSFACFPLDVFVTILGKGCLPLQQLSTLVSVWAESPSHPVLKVRAPKGACWPVSRARVCTISHTSVLTWVRRAVWRGAAEGGVRGSGEESRQARCRRARL